MKIVNTIEEIRKHIAQSKLLLIYFSSNSCNVCVSLLPKLSEMLGHYTGLEAIKVEIDHLPEISGEFSIFTMPCILVYAEGKELLREARFISLRALEDKLDRYMEILA